MTLESIIEVGINGISHGLLLALMGAGITLVFGLGELLNLAQGAFAVLTAIIAYVLSVNYVSPILGIFIALVAIGVAGLFIDQVLLGSVYRSEGEERIMIGIFATLGLSLFIEGILFQLYPTRFALPVELPSVEPFGITILGADLLTFFVSGVVLLLLFAFLKWTFLGKATRTIAQDTMGAQLCGVTPRRIRTLIFIQSTLLAGIAGVLYAIDTNLAASGGFELTVEAVIVAVVGGVRNVVGTIVAGILLGLVLAFTGYFIGSYVALIIMFVTAMGALVIRQKEFEL